jgi:hypothetical protein
MKCLVLCLLFVTAGCQSKSKSAEPGEPTSKTEEAKSTAPITATERDLDRMCNSLEQSGALDLQPAERAMHVGIWLAENLESQEVRDLSAALTKLGPEDRTARLQQELTKHGIATCEILHSWAGK